MKISSLIIGRGKGSAGNVTVVQLKGQTILKQKAEIVANPRTPAQMTQRSMINRAVYVWQLFGNVIKTGWTSLLPFCSEYNTFVSVNSLHFVSSTFTKENLKLADLVGSQATKGSLGVLQADEFLIASGLIDATFLVNSIVGGIKAGDKIKMLGGSNNGSEAGYDYYTVTPSDVLNGSISNTFTLGSDLSGTNSVIAFWLETADGNKSTSAKFLLYP